MLTKIIFVHIHKTEYMGERDLYTDFNIRYYFTSIYLSIYLAQSAGAVEYTDCISAEG